MKCKSLWFIIACLVVCLIPSVGMLFFPTTETTENRSMAEAPELRTEEGDLNTEFFRDFETYFNEHIALRNPLVYLDAKIQTGLFHTSNVGSVICGTDGWLYYSSTLDDYLGTSLLSQRELYNLAHNFSIVQEYLKERGIAFVLTIPPNKNTLYGEHMPYYDAYLVNSDHNAKLLAPYLSEQKIRYANLFDLFETQDEVLYLQRDSHWNGKGAYLAYSELMEALKREYTEYDALEPEKNENGDLNKMLYSFYGPLEENVSYDIPEYTYENEVDSVEDGWIVTKQDGGRGTLLMFRDSFANTLIPFLANEFETAYFSKGEPNMLERFVEDYSPDCVVIEKVERNITAYLNEPPILSAVETEALGDLTVSAADATVTIESCENDVLFYKISGTITADRLQDNSEILVAVDDHVYRAYQTGERDYLLYLKKSAFTETTATVRVYLVNEDVCVQVLCEEIGLH